MHVLGISCHYHDAAAALLRDGVLVAAAQEERFSRKKHDAAFPLRAIEFCLQQAGLEAADLDYVVFYEKPFAKGERLMTTIVATFPRSLRLFREGIHVWLKEKIWIKALIQKHLGTPPDRILFVDHHVSHAASAFFASPFEDAAVLTVDGVGEWTTATCGRGSGDWGQRGTNRLELSQELRFPHSLGLLYSVFTAFLGFEVNEGEYKVMGMAPFGQPRYVEQIRSIMELREDGSLWLDPAYMRFHDTERAFTRRFEAVFGAPRNPKARFVTAATSLYDDPNPPTTEELRRNQYYADLAASIQQVTEDVMIAMARHVHRQTGLTKLCLAGGVALNCVANYKVLRATPFEEIYVAARSVRRSMRTTCCWAARAGSSWITPRGARPTARAPSPMRCATDAGASAGSTTTSARWIRRWTRCSAARSSAGTTDGSSGGRARSGTARSSPIRGVRT